jgi:hypothetical protein
MTVRFNNKRKENAPLPVDIISQGISEGQSSDRTDGPESDIKGGQSVLPSTVANKGANQYDSRNCDSELVKATGECKRRNRLAAEINDANQASMGRVNMQSDSPKTEPQALTKGIVADGNKTPLHLSNRKHKPNLGLNTDDIADYKVGVVRGNGFHAYLKLARHTLFFICLCLQLFNAVVAKRADKLLKHNLAYCICMGNAIQCSTSSKGALTQLVNPGNDCEKQTVVIFPHFECTTSPAFDIYTCSEKVSDMMIFSSSLPSPYPSDTNLPVN